MYNPITGTGSGIAPVVNLTWPWLDQDHVKASVNGVSAAINWTGASQVTFVDPVAAGAQWTVYRETPADAPLVDYTDGSVLTEADLDLAQSQYLYRLEELSAHLPADVRKTIEAILTAGANVTITPSGGIVTIAATDTNTTDPEVVRDTIAAALVAGAGITVTHNDAGNTITIANTVTPYTDEMARDALGAALVAGANVTITPNDAGDTITISATDTNTTDPEVVRDTMAAALVAGANVTITPDDVANTITIAATGGGSTDPEVVRDTMAAALVAGANVTITPNDAGDTITISAAGGGGGGLADGDYGDVVVGGGATTMTVESAAPSDGSFNVTGHEVVSGGLVIGAEAGTPGYVTSQLAHRAEINATGVQTPLMIGGGSGAIEIWKEASVTIPTAGVSFGMALSGSAITNDFVFGSFNGTVWAETARIVSATKALQVVGPVTASNLSGTNTGDQFTSTTASRLLGRGSAAGAGAAQEITLGVTLGMSGTTLNVAKVPNAVTFAASGGSAAGAYDGSAAKTVDYSTVGAAPDTPRIQSVTSAASVTPTFANDQVNITAQAVGLTLANPTGTAKDGYGIAIRIKDNGSAQTIAYGTQYRAIGVTLPTTTVASKTLYLGMVYNAADTKWDVVSVAQEA